jgi:drug/metabolite transporter (DMT)-like permease
VKLAFLKNIKVQSILLIIVSKFSFVSMMAFSKLLKNYSPLQLNFIRSFLVFSVITPYLLTTRGKTALQTKQPFFQLIRMGLSVGSMICFFYGYRMLPIAKASAINFSYALMVPLFASLFLKEKVSRQRWAFLILGYIGIFIIINPVFETFELGEFVALLGVILLAAASIFVKHLTKTDESLVVVFYSSIATSILLGLYFIGDFFFTFHNPLPQWTPLKEQDGWILLSMGIFSLLGQFSYVQAYRKGRLNFLAGFDYLKFLFAILIGILFFNEPLEATTFYGALIILVCSYAIAREELKMKSNYENY